MNYLKVNGSSLAYKARWADNAQGSILFVHGSGGDSHIWEEQIKQLPFNFSGVAIDLPGHGASNGPLLDTIEAGARFINMLPDLLHMPRPIWLAGHSMGSAMALTAALNYPQQTDGLILIGSGSRLRVMPQILAALQTGKMNPEFLRIGFSSATPASVWEKEIAALLKVGTNIIYNDFKACDQFDRSADIEQIKIPTLVIAGEDDKLTPLKYSQFLDDRLASSKLVVIPQAGHYVMLEKPEEVSRAIADFVSSIKYF
ncbi:MAG: alpha/beta hydrolase [Syntrophomonadaceae bacterium]|nr:alpha/beta hydrolase [Syntrophomonadaceae bacterium]